MVEYYDISDWEEQNYFNTGGTRNKVVVQNPKDMELYYFKTSLKKEAKDYKYEFWSEISSLSRMKLSTESLSEGDILRWEKDVHNKHDEKAVKLYKNDTYVGYVKRIHSRVFYKRNAEKLKVYIKSINKNGHINRVFIKVTF